MSVLWNSAFWLQNFDDIFSRHRSLNLWLFNKRLPANQSDCLLKILIDCLLRCVQWCLVQYMFDFTHLSQCELCPVMSGVVHVWLHSLVSMCAMSGDVWCSTCLTSLTCLDDSESFRETELSGWVNCSTGETSAWSVSDLCFWWTGSYFSFVIVCNNSFNCVKVLGWVLNVNSISNWTKMTEKWCFCCYYYCVSTSNSMTMKDRVNVM